MLPATRDLLTALDPLPHPERTRRLVAWARGATDRAEVCAELRTLGSYEGRLALLAAVVTGDADGVTAGTRDPQPSLRTAALDAALRLGLLPPDLTDLSAAERRTIYRTLRRLPAPGLADALVAGVRATFGDGEAALLLPGCGPETVRALLPDLEQAVDLERLARRHPGPVLARAAERLAGATAEGRTRVWTEVAGAVLTGDPAAALDLLERYAPGRGLPGDLSAYGRLAAHHPGRVARLLAAPTRTAWLGSTHLPLTLLRRLAALPTAELTPLAVRLRDYPRHLAGLLKAVAPARRAELYEAAVAGFDRSAWDPAHAVVEVLPAAARIEAVTRLLGRDKARSTDEVLLWRSYLAWPEAVAALEPRLRSGDADQRAEAYRLLAHAARRARDPQAVTELVHRLGRLRNEQDPVRAAALGALTGVARLLTAGSAPELTALTTDAADARDTSPASTTALLDLAAATLQHHVEGPELREWALLTIDRVSTGTAAPPLRRFDRVLRRGQEDAVFARLRGWIEAAMDRGEYSPLFAVTRALGRRAWRVPELQDLLRQAAGAEKPADVAREAAGLWLAGPRSRADRAAELLAADPSAVTLQPVWTTIAAVRTDLLDRVLDRAPAGRFIEDGVRWVPPTAVHPERWLPRQRAAFVALQEQVVADTGTGVRLRAAAIGTAARVPDAGRELVLRHLDDPEVVLAEAALEALARTDLPGEALPVLLRHAGGDRARVALYAAGRAARHVAPSLLPGLLGPVLTAPPGQAKVTSRKEAARLLAGLGAAGVMETLLRAYADPGAHRDVRAAIASAARERLGDEESWTILAAAAAGSPEECRAVLAAGPYGMADRFRPRYVALLVAACRAADPDVRGTAFDQLPEWAPWAADLGDLIAHRLADLDEKVSEHQAGRLAFVLDEDRLVATMDRLADREAADDRPGGGAVDRPARRRIEAIAEGAASRSQYVPVATDRSALLAAARRLAVRPTHTGTGIVMLTALGGLRNLDEIADLCADRPVLAVRAQQQVGAGWYRTGLPPEELSATAARLAARGDLAGGLLAVALTDRGGRYAWPQPWRGLLTELRRHPDATVREEAYACDMTT